MRTDALDFELPDGLIATHPVSPRDSSRLLVVSRSDPDRIEDRVFSELPEVLDEGDVLVFNRTRVVSARLVGRVPETGGRVEGLFVSDLGGGRWGVMLRAKRARPGRVIELEGPDGSGCGVELVPIEKDERLGPGAWVVEARGGGTTDEMLDRAGRTPLPPYILGRRRALGDEGDDDRDRSDYQTVFARDGSVRSVAAPTAGLHFTPGLIERIERAGIATDEVVLEVGAGTFKPIETARVEDHEMHSERCALGPALDRFGSGKPDRRVVAVGSTSARTLETFSARWERGESMDGMVETRLLITPGYGWGWVDVLLTNFHLPRSTLIAMVASALEVPGEIDGVERVRSVYAHAISEGYRFYSFGDAMVILP